MKNIIFNKTKSFVGRNTSEHACQIFCSKSNWNYVSLIFSPRDNRGQNNETISMFAPPTAIYTYALSLSLFNLITKGDKITVTWSEKVQYFIQEL
jgi:hypothetical protein